MITETLAPNDSAQVAAAVRQAAASGTPLYPIGGGTRQGYGVRPTRPGLGLSLGALASVVDYPARDLTITVEAGFTLAALEQLLAAQGQRLPIDVPCPDRATIGGVVATNPSGPRRFAWGTLRDYVLGLRAVDGRGVEFAAGGRVVKNAAGYDLCKLVIGSLGTLCVVTQVTLMVRPLPETAAFVVCDLPDLDALERRLEGLVHSPARPMAVDFLAGPAWADDPALGPLPASAVGRLVVGFEGPAAEVAWMLEQVSGTAMPAETAAGALFRKRFLTPFSAGNGQPALDVCVTALPSRVVAVIGHLLRVRPGCSIQAHAGNGVVHARIALADAGEAAGLLATQLRPAVVAAGGNLVVTAHPADAALGIDEVWGPPGPAHAVMQRLKEQFDPQHVLNPGRFVFPDR